MHIYSCEVKCSRSSRLLDYGKYGIWTEDKNKQLFAEKNTSIFRLAVSAY